MKTKKRSERFPIRKKKSLTIWLMHDKPDNFYLAEVDAYVLGDFGYHCKFSGYYTVFHLPTGSWIGAFKKEAKAKTLIKKLYIKVPQGLSVKDEKFSKPVISICEKMKIETKIDNIKYNEEEDIPF